MEDQTTKKKIMLDDSQKAAVLSAFKYPITIITGPGGSGKSTVCKTICDIAKSNGLSVRLMSPTGKAAQVLIEKTFCHASTIHRSLKLRPDDDVPKESITEDIVIVDEISMSGIDTMYAIMKAMENNYWGNLIFVGDKNQLPSVSPGNFLSDIMQSGCANIVTLNKIHRQDEGSFISLLANNISMGKNIDIPTDATDMSWHQLVVDNYKEKLVEFIKNYIKSNNIFDLQIMSPMKKGACGVHKTNEIVQDLMAELNGTKSTFIQRGFAKFYVSDKVIQIENNYEKMIFNGDMGTIVDLGEKVVDSSVSDKKEKYITVSFYGEQISFFGDEIDQLQLAWCITVHKFQGSQSKDILFIMAGEAEIMMSKELVYTAFTRAEKKLDIFGVKRLLTVAASKSVIKKRYTNVLKIINDLKSEDKKLIILSESAKK